MSNELKCESHISRRNRSKEVEYVGELRCQKYVTEQDFDEISQRVVVKTKLKSFKPADNFKGYKCSDFSLDNIIAAGAIDMLSPCPSYGQPNIDTTVDTMTTAFDSIATEQVTSTQSED